MLATPHSELCDAEAAQGIDRASEGSHPDHGWLGSPVVLAWLVPPLWGLAALLARQTGGLEMTSPPWPAGAYGLSGQLLALALLAACATDLRWRKIRNWTTYPAIVYGLLLNAGTSLAAGTAVADWLGGIGFVSSLTGGLICFGGALALYLLFGGGAGDVKLVTVLGCFLGWRLAVDIWLLAILSAASFALAWIAGRGIRVAVPLMQSVLATQSNDSREMARRLITSWLRFRIPLAPFFFVATLIAVGVPTIWPGRTALSSLLRLF